MRRKLPFRGGHAHARRTRGPKDQLDRASIPIDQLATIISVRVRADAARRREWTGTSAPSSRRCGERRQDVPARGATGAGEPFSAGGVDRSGPASLTAAAGGPSWGSACG
jgi:hypothetical protein